MIFLKVKTGNDLLPKGILALRRTDGDIERLIGPRNDEVVSLLNRYIKEIGLFNPAYGLVGTSDPEELITRHILDSLAPLGIIARLIHDSISPRIADAGSGAGLPGIPLAIALHRCEFTLIERMGRRAGFLWNTKAALRLSNVTVEEGELERTTSPVYGLVTFRAFKPLEPKLLKAVSRICAENGVIAAYKGRREKIEREMSPLEDSCVKWEAIPYTVPFLDEERHLLIIRPPVAS